ncbi:hypothetical protein BHE74_00033299, partial [Ensete ventricosum]
PAVVSRRSRSSTRWTDPPCPTPEVDCWSGGVRVGRRRLSSGRAQAPARRSGRVSSRRDPSDGQVSVMVDFAIPLPHRGERTFIVSDVGHSYLISLLPLLLTMSSYLSIMPIVLAVRRAPAGEGGIASRSNTGCTFRSLGIAPIVWTLPACASRWMLWKPVSIWGFRLDWSAHPIGNASPYLSEEETVLVGRLKRILEAPKASSKRPVGASPVREAPKASSKRSIDAAAEDAVTRHKKVKVLTRRHKSHLGERERRSRSKGKEPTTPSEEPETPAGSEEGGVSPTHRRPRSMKDLFKTKVHKGDAGYYTLLISDLGYQDPEKEMKARWKGLKNSTKVWNNSSAVEEFERGLLHPQLAWELYMLPSEILMARAVKEMVLLLISCCFMQSQHFQMALFDRVHDVGRLITFMDYRLKQLQEELDALKYDGGPEPIAKAEGHASELQEELEKTRREREMRHEASKKELHKELHEVRSNLAEAHRLLKEARVRARKMDDELLQAVKAPESARAELLRQIVVQYKESLGFKEGLKRMGRVTYEYGYRVALARFHARHPDAEVKEDPFTIHLEDDLVPMERQQAFDDSVPPEP